MNQNEQFVREQEVQKAYSHRHLVEKIGRAMKLSDLSDMVMERIAIKAYNLKFADVENDRHYQNLLYTTIRHEYADLTKSELEQALRNGDRFEVPKNGDPDKGCFDLPASRVSDPSIQAQAQEELRLVMKALDAYASKSKSSRQAVRIFRAFVLGKESPKDIARVEHVQENAIYVTTHRLREYLCKAMHDMAI